MKKVALCAIMGIMAAVCVLAQTPATRENVITVKKTVDYQTDLNYLFDTWEGRTYYLGLWTDAPAYLPAVSTFVNDDGSVTVCAFDETNKRTHIYEYNEELVEQKTLTFANEFDRFGAFTKDKDGNYYIFYGKSVNNKEEHNMAMVKYDRNGQKTKTYYLLAGAPGTFYGVMVPFHFSPCRLEISGSMLAVYFGRTMFEDSKGINHQASCGFVLNKDTFARIDNAAAGAGSQERHAIPYVSHSFDQFILPVDNGFIFADKGDASPRSFAFAKFQYGARTVGLNTFRFPGQNGQNVTYSQLGGIAKTSTGYIFAGTTPDEPWDIMQNINKNNSRNLFIITIKEDFSASNPRVNITSLGQSGERTGETRHATFPKIVDLGGGMYLLLWEEVEGIYDIVDQLNRDQLEYLTSEFKGLYMQIIDETGKKLTDKIKIEGARIGRYDIPRYNSRNGFVYWSTNNQIRNEIQVIGLNTRNYTAGIRAVNKTKNYTVKNEQYFARQETQNNFPVNMGYTPVPTTPAMVRVNGGTFTMGSPANEPGRNANEGQQRRVTVGSFYMGKFEVTQKEWFDVMGTTIRQQRDKITNSYVFGEGDNFPMHYVSWFEAVEYCNRRSLKEGLTPAYTVEHSTIVTWNRSADGYRLPTEAEWEYACRAGTTTAFNTGENISDSTGWYRGIEFHIRREDENGTVVYTRANVNSTNPVGQKPANRFGLHDMHGNVSEWCWDLYGAYPSEAQTDPVGASSGYSRVIRDGSWESYETAELRSAYRSYSSQEYRGISKGFRIVRNLD